MSEELHDDKAITFAVRAHNDAHIGFFESNDAGGDAGDFEGGSHGAQYEIVLSGWDGTQSVIREAAQGENHAVTDTTNIIDENDSRQFWASAANGVIRLGRGNVVGFNVLLQWQDPDACSRPALGGCREGWGSDGDWTVCIPRAAPAGTTASKPRLQAMCLSIRLTRSTRTRRRATVSLAAASSTSGR